MKKILVTGGCGFLGSHICELFRKMDWNVVAFDNLTKFEYSRTGYKTDDVREYNPRFLRSIGVGIIEGDVRDVATLGLAIEGCDFVAHCAAQPAMTIAIEDPLLDFEVNVQGTLNVLRACRKENVPVVNCSTIHVYGNEGINHALVEEETRLVLPSFPINEYHPLLEGLISPLHASKRTAELYVQTYIDTYKLPAANFRLTGIYGPRQFGGEDHGWVANFIIKTILGRPIKIFGTDKQVRDILYVKDAANAFRDWFAGGCVPGTYNIGGGEDTSISIQELLVLVESITDKRSEVEMLPKRHGDLWWFISDYSKATETFNWSPLFMPKEGVLELIEWVEDNSELFIES